MAAVPRGDVELADGSDSEDDGEDAEMAALQARLQAARTGRIETEARAATAIASTEETAKKQRAEISTIPVASETRPVLEMADDEPEGLGLGARPLVAPAPAVSDTVEAAVHAAEERVVDAKEEEEAEERLRHERHLRLQAQREESLVRALQEVTGGDTDKLQGFKRASADFRHERCTAAEYRERVEALLGPHGAERILPLAAAAVPVPERRLALVQALREAERARALDDLKRQRESRAVPSAAPPPHGGGRAKTPPKKTPTNRRIIDLADGGSSSRAVAEPVSARQAGPTATAAPVGGGGEGTSSSSSSRRDLDVPATSGGVKPEGAASSSSRRDLDVPATSGGAKPEGAASSSSRRDLDVPATSGGAKPGGTSSSSSVVARRDLGSSFEPVVAGSSFAGLERSKRPRDHVPDASGEETSIHVESPVPSLAKPPHPKEPSHAKEPVVDPQEVAMCRLRGGVFHVHVYGITEETGGDGKKFTEYILKCSWSREACKREWLVGRRYREFDALHTLLLPYLEDCPEHKHGAALPRLPGKSLFGWSTGQVAETRRRGLALWLVALLRGFPWVLDLDDVDRFLHISPRLAAVFNEFAVKDAHEAVAAVGVGLSSGPPPLLDTHHGRPALGVHPGRLASLGVRIPPAEGEDDAGNGAPFSPSVAAARAALGAPQGEGAEDAFAGIFSPTGGHHGTPPRGQERGLAGFASDPDLAGLMSPSAAGRSVPHGAIHSVGADRPDDLADAELSLEELGDAEATIAALAAHLQTIDLTRTDPRKDPALQTMVLRVRIAIARLATTREELMRRAADDGSSSDAALVPRVMQAEEDAAAVVGDYQSVLAVVRAMHV
jgi:hypothetical protein